MQAGVEGWGLTQVEHFSPKSLEAVDRNNYVNCFYICARCNRSRGKAPQRDPFGRSLLNPCDRAWGDLFVMINGELMPRNSENTDVTYTQETYRLNDRRKVRLRRLRRETIEERRGFLERSSHYITEVLDKIATGGTSADVEMAREISRQRRTAVKDLFQYLAIPHDRDRSCLCGHTGHHTLPRALEEQTFDLGEFLRH
jgi:hypothetical protein